MGNRRREGEDMRRHGLSKTHVGSVHTRRTKRAASTANRRTGPLLRAVTAPPRDRRYAARGSVAVSVSFAETISNSSEKESNDSGGCKRERNEGRRRRRGGRCQMEEDGERESGASIGYGYDEDARSPFGERMLEHEESDR